MTTTSHPAVEAVLQGMLARLESLSRPKLVGMYIHGSLATGDFEPDASDLDVLVVVASDVSADELNALDALHARLREEHPDWGDRLDVQYLSVEALATFKSRDHRAVLIGPGEPLRFEQVGKHWLMNWHVVRERRITLFGPDPRTLIEPIANEDVLASIKEHVAAWSEWVMAMRSPKAQSYAILTLCRNLVALRQGRIVSKREGAAEARRVLPHRAGLIDSALAWRHSSPAADTGEATHAATVDFVSEVRRLVLG